MSKVTCVKKNVSTTISKKYQIKSCSVYCIEYLCERKVAYIYVVGCMGDNSISISRKNQVLCIRYLKMYQRNVQ